MAFTGKLAAVDGRRLLFGKRDETTRKYEREFALAPDGRVVKGTWPDFDPAFLSDLKNGMEVRLCGVKGDATSGECHTVVIADKASNRSRTHELADREAAKAAKGAKRAKK